VTALEAAAAAAGATQLGEDGPDGCHWIFSAEELERFARLVARELPALPAPPY
jgi:hypothetical protein